MLILHIPLVSLSFRRERRCMHGMRESLMLYISFELTFDCTLLHQRPGGHVEMVLHRSISISGLRSSLASCRDRQSLSSSPGVIFSSLVPCLKVKSRLDCGWTPAGCGEPFFFSLRPMIMMTPREEKEGRTNNIFSS